MELANARIDQLPLGAPTLGDFLVFRDMLNGVTKRMPYTQSETSNNFEWLSSKAAAGDYDTNDVVTYGGNWYQSTIDDNLSVPGTNATWTLLTKSSSGGWWQAGVYSEDQPWVLSDHNGSAEIFVLASLTRPYNSTNIATEELSGDWVSITNPVRARSYNSLVSPMQFDFKNSIESLFSSADPINAARAIQLLNDTRALKFEASFEVSALPAPITMPASFIMSDALWDNGGKIWTPLDVGKYFMKASKLNGNWMTQIFGPFN